MLCRDWTLVKPFDGGIYAAPLCCRSWTCNYCSPERKRQVTRQAAAGHPNTLITLTVNPDHGYSPIDRAEDLVLAWRKFVKLAKKHYGYKSIPYFCVFEATKNGEPHLHILARVKWIAQPLISKFMKTEINAPIVDIRRCNSERSAARYIAKYIGKAPGKFGTCKRYWQTRDYQDQDIEDAQTKREKDPAWYIVEEPIDYFIWHAHNQHLTAVQEGDIWKIQTRAPP